MIKHGVHSQYHTFRARAEGKRRRKGKRKRGGEREGKAAAGNQQVQSAALYFQKLQSGSQFPLQDSGVILQAPRYFSRFVASTLMDTLPQR